MQAFDLLRSALFEAATESIQFFPNELLVVKSIQFFPNELLVVLL